MNLKKEDKEYLLKLARKSLEYFFQNGRKYTPNPETIPKNLREKAATFVTLTKNENLRGCIGHLTPIYPLYKDVIENTYSAAFYDSRFYPLTKEELDDITIEISVLTHPKPLKFSSYKELLRILDAEKPGVVLLQSGRSATFLPQVWDDLPKPDEFLMHLAIKGGISLDKNSPNFDIKTYSVKKFSEEDIS